MSVDLTAPRSPMLAANPDFHVGLLSHTRSMSTSMKQSGKKKGGGVAVRPFKDDIMFVVKVQINTSGFNTNDPMGMIVYDKSRRFNWIVSCINCPAEAYRRLDTTIRFGKIYGKGYFKAYFSKEKLVILVNNPLPLQQW